MNKKYAVFTMDLEGFTDTECVANSGAAVPSEMLDGFDIYIRLLEKYNIRATLFTLCNTAAQMRDKLRRCIARGHQMALHGWSHIAPLLMDPEHFRTETAQAKSFLEREFGVKIRGYRAPCFSLDNQRLDILRSLGFRYDASRNDFSAARHTVQMDMGGYLEVTSGVFHDRGFCEFGLSHGKLFGMNFPISGGGYVRLFNWAVMKAAIRRYLRTHDYYVFYLHPFELSRERVPAIPGLKGYDQFYLNYGHRSFAGKVEDIILMLQSEGYEFVTFDELTDLIQQQRC